MTELLALAVAGALYARGARRLARRGPGLSTGQAACFAAGIAVLAMALLSPLDALAGALFAAHMAQHLLLILVAAPLLALAAPAAPLLWGLPAAPRRRVVRAWPRWLRRPLRDPAFAWVLHTAVLWGWHLPPLYQAALRSGPLHALEHASFLATALPYWAVLVRLARPDATRQGVGVVYAFLAMLQSGVLGALITLSAAPWYPLHAETTAAWGLTPLEDQQLAGLVMWVPASLVYLAAGLALTLRWLAAVEAADRRREERAGLPRP